MNYFEDNSIETAEKHYPVRSHVVVQKVPDGTGDNAEEVIRMFLQRLRYICKIKKIRGVFVK